MRVNQTFTMEIETRRRLKAHSERTGKDMSHIIEEALLGHLPEGAPYTTTAGRYVKAYGDEGAVGELRPEAKITIHRDGSIDNSDGLEIVPPQPDAVDTFDEMVGKLERRE